MRIGLAKNYCDWTSCDETSGGGFDLHGMALGVGEDNIWIRIFVREGYDIHLGFKMGS